MDSKSRRPLNQIPRGEPRLLEGARLFNAGAFFESHEAWESLWHEVEGQERLLLQGLIQLAAAYHHLTHRNAAGARYLYTKGRARLVPWLPAHAGLELREWLTQVDSDFQRAGQGQPIVQAPSLKVTSE